MIKIRIHIVLEEILNKIEVVNIHAIFRNRQKLSKNQSSGKSGSRRYDRALNSAPPFLATFIAQGTMV